VNQSDKKVFVISLDGATWEVLKPLMAQGYLPYLQALAKAGISAGLRSVIPPVTASAWTSFMTGKNPSKHGIFDFTSFDLSNYRWGINTAKQIRSKTMWQILSEKDKRVVVVNLPYTYPPSEINGVMISGWDAPSGDTNFTYPSSLRARILEMFPDYSSNLWVSEFRPQESEEHFQKFTATLIRGFEQGAALASNLLDNESWDVFMIHFQQTDWIQHKLWDHIEQACHHPQDKSPKVEAIRNCYRRFDELVGTLLTKVAPLNPLTIVLSDHGFGRHMGTVCPNYYLHEWGHYHLRDESKESLQGLKTLLRESNFEPVKQVYKAAVKAKSLIKGKVKLSQEHSSWADSTTAVIAHRGETIDWARTQVATVWAYKVGFLFVNLSGRSAQGIVQPGAEYENLVSELISKFRNVRHPKTGEPLFIRVGRGSEIYPQSHGVQLPDIVLIPQDGYGLSFSISDAPPEISSEGGHRPTGVLMMAGAGLKTPGSTFSPHLVDIAPTVFHWLGLPVPSDMDGSVMLDVIADPTTVQYEEMDNHQDTNATGYSAHEAEFIEQRLKGLGYVE